MVLAMVYGSVRIDALRPDMRQRAGGPVINITDELVWELQDKVERLDRKVSRLLALAGEDPEEAGRLSDEIPAAASEAKAA